MANAQSAQFQNHVPICSPVLGCPPNAPLRFLSGWVAADATLRGRTARVVTTHLDPLSRTVQEAQAVELLDGPLDTALSTILLGDLNSAAGGVGATPGTDTQTYNRLLAAGFTCCQAPDLRNPTSTLSQRIDYVLFRGSVTALTANLVGHTQADRTPSGLWPSDHAGVRSVLQLH